MSIFYRSMYLRSQIVQGGVPATCVSSRTLQSGPRCRLDEPNVESTKTHTRGTLYQAVYYLTLNWYITPTYIPGISWPVESKTSGGHGYYHYVLPGCVSATRLTWCGTSSLCLSVDVLVSRRAVDVLVVSRSMREIGWCGCRLDVHRGAL